jgi:hypothetical protein
LAPTRTTSYFTDVSISGSQAVVTGSFQTLSFQTHGVVDVLQQSRLSSWAKTQRIELVAASSQINDVAIEDGTIFIGDYKRVVANGPIVYAVEVYKDSPAGFQFVQSIVPPVSSVAFGSSVSVDGNRLLVGASSEAGHGAAYIYERGPGDIWIEAAHLVPSDLANRYLIGTDVALRGDFAYITSWDSPNGLGDGRVYVFERDDLGNWLEIAKLSSPLAQATFGHSLVAVEGQLLVGSGVNYPGAVHVFTQVPEPTIACGVAMLVICLVSELGPGREIGNARLRHCAAVGFPKHVDQRRIEPGVACF